MVRSTTILIKRRFVLVVNSLLFEASLSWKSRLER